jgi:hypothetical protein
MFHVNPEDLMNHKEATKSRQNLIRNQRIHFSGSWRILECLILQMHWAIPDFGPDQPDYTWHSTVLQQSLLLEIPAGFQQVAELHLQGFEIRGFTFQGPDEFWNV